MKGAYEIFKEGISKLYEMLVDEDNKENAEYYFHQLIMFQEIVLNFCANGLLERYQIASLIESIKSIDKFYEREFIK